MHIEHVAIWTHNLDQLRAFYELYFEAQSGEKYVNPNKGFESYFLQFASGARLELMSMPTIPQTRDDITQQFKLRSAGDSGHLRTRRPVFSVAKHDLVTLLSTVLETGEKEVDKPALPTAARCCCWIFSP